MSTELSAVRLRLTGPPDGEHQDTAAASPPNPDRAVSGQRKTPLWLATQEWELSAGCSGVDTDIFYRFGTERGAARRAAERDAKQICRRCAVVDHCMQRALSAREPHGIWGGLTPEERTALLHDRTA